MPVEFAPTPREEMEAAHHMAASVSPLPPAPVNGRAVREYTQPERLYYRGRRFVLRPLPYLVGIELVEALHQLAEIDERLGAAEAFRRHVRLNLLVIDILKECARPPGVRGWFWRWARNPFADATEKEIEDLARFFERARTMSSVGHRPGRTETSREP